MTSSTYKQGVVHTTEELYHELLNEHEKALTKIQELQEKVDQLRLNLRIPEQLRENVWIKGDQLIQTTYLDISSIQAINGGISIKLNDMTTIFLWSSLKKYQEQLPLSYFKRISKSCIINTYNIERRINQHIEMQNGDKFKISESYEKGLNAKHI